MGISFSKTFDPIRDLPDLTGKVVIVTGGNSGIGFTTVQHLARKGAKVYLAARSESKATGALARLDAEGLGPGNGQVVWLKLDLSHPKDAKAAAEDFLAKEARLDILINNAAVLLTEFNVGPLGIQETMIVNHFSPFVFTSTLLPILKTTAKEPGSDVRIVNLSSELHTVVPAGTRYQSKADFNVGYQNQYLAKMKRYGSSKLCNILFNDELQRRFDAENIPIICISIHPGGVHTEGNIKYYEVTWGAAINTWLSSKILYTPQQGAFTSVIAAAAMHVRENVQVYKAAYLKPIGQLGKKSKIAKDENGVLAGELWESTERLLEEMGVPRS